MMGVRRAGRCLSATLLMTAASSAALAQAGDPQSQRSANPDHSSHAIVLTRDGMIMNNNSDALPRDCTSVNGEATFTVYAGMEYALAYPGTVYGMSEHEYRAEPCSRITVTFVNKDQVRHQWMLHGLPKYLYPQGMFTLEAAGGQTQTGSFIVPSDRKTYLVHCDVAQHMEKGMKAQLKVGGGDGDLWAVPGTSAGFEPDQYLPRFTLLWTLLAAVAGSGFAALLLARAKPH